MTRSDTKRAATPWRGRILAIVLTVAGGSALLAANAHFIYVAFTSQPGCVPHTGAAYSPAKSSC